ncbi:MAG: hypothetical protein ACLFPJ_06045, partial [Candidatus Woesearchaeota archaeon]
MVKKNILLISTVLFMILFSFSVLGTTANVNDEAELLTAIADPTITKIILEDNINSTSITFTSHNVVLDLNNYLLNATYIDLNNKDNITINGSNRDESRLMVDFIVSDIVSLNLSGSVGFKLKNLNLTLGESTTWFGVHEEDYVFENLYIYAKNLGGMAFNEISFDAINITFFEYYDGNNRDNPKNNQTHRDNGFTILAWGLNNENVTFNDDIIFMQEENIILGGNGRFIGNAIITSQEPTLTIQENISIGKNIKIYPDVISPEFTTIPDNISISYTGLWNGVNFYATDNNYIDKWFINDTINFEINETGFLNWTKKLSVSDYYINVSVNDTSGNINSTIYNLNITKSQDNCEVVFNETSPLTYPQTFNVSTNCTTEFTLYRNGTEIDNNSVQELSAGVYNFTVIRTDQENYTNVYDEKEFIINKANPVLAIDGDSPIIYGVESNFVGTGCPEQLDCEMNTSNGIYPVGTHTFNYSTAGNENYTSAYFIKDLIVNENIDNCDILFNETSPLTYPQTFNVST